jgi:hypothetical protein
MTEARHDLVPLSEPDRWNAALAEVPHGHAHTWGFCHAVQRTSRLPTYLYRYERGEARVVCPLSEREFGGQTDIVTPYGFGGFATRGPGERFPDDWGEFARASGWVCGYLALHPLLCDARGFPTDELHVHTQLYVMDLKGSAEEVFRRLSQNRRRQLRDWPSVAPGLCHDRSALTDFLLANYEEFFASKGAASATTFVPETMEGIAGLDDVFMVGAGADGEVESVAAFGHTPRCGEYLFNVSVPGGEKHAVHLIWAAVQWLRDRGVASLNLGGGIRPQDSVAEFKRRFGGAELPLVSLRQVYLAGEYERLCRMAGVSLTDRSGYFPAYRA